MSNAIDLISFLRDAISDYASHADEQEPAEWLQGYLGEKLPDKSKETIHSISSELISTLDLMEEKKAAMKAAMESGESAENWFTKEAMKDDVCGAAEKARKAAEFFNGIKSAEKSYDSEKEVEVIDVDGEVWTDEKWNDYRLKSTFKDVAVEAGRAGLREVASEAFLKASEEGIASVFEDSEFVQRSIEKGALAGIKTAVSAGLTIAEETGVIPPTSLEIIAATAHKTVETFVVFGEVIRGQRTMTEAIVEVKNIAVSTFSALWHKHGSKALHEIKEKVTDLFGIKGAVVSGVVTGLVTEPKNESKLVHVIKETGKAVGDFITRHVPVLNTLKKAVFSFFS